MSTKMIQPYFRLSNWALILYLSVMISGCAIRPDEISPEAARVLQTRELSGTPEEIARASIVVLQEMHYTLGNVDMGLGVITAERTSERLLAPISREMGEPELADEIGTFCLIAGAMAAVGLILAWIFGDMGDDDDDDDDDYDHDRGRRSRGHHHDSSPIIFNSDDSGPDSYQYNMTITLAEVNPMQTKVHVTVQGQHWEGSSISETGPVQSQEFYAEFFSRLQIALNR